MRSPFQKRNRGQRKAKSTSQPPARAATGGTGKSQLSSTQSDQYPRRATRFPGRLERLLTRATDNSRYRPEIIPGVRCRYLRRVFIGCTPQWVVVVVTEDLVEENAEAMFLCVI